MPLFDADGFAWTQPTSDDLAFNYFSETGALTIPLQCYANGWADQSSGFIAFSVRPTAGFTELGRLDRSDPARQAYCSDPNAVALAPAVRVSRRGGVGYAVNR